MSSQMAVLSEVMTVAKDDPDVDDLFEIAGGEADGLALVAQGVAKLEAAQQARRQLQQLPASVLRSRRSTSA